MEKELVLSKIRQLEVGESFNVNLRKNELKYVSSEIKDMRIKILKVSELLTTIIRVAPFDQTFIDTVTEQCDKLDTTEPIQINGSVGFCRNIVSKYNKKKDRSIKVKKIDLNSCIIFELIDKKKVISQFEFDFEKKNLQKRLSELALKVEKEELL